MLTPEKLDELEPKLSAEVADLIESRLAEVGDPDEVEIAAMAEFAFIETLRRLSKGSPVMFLRLVSSHQQNLKGHAMKAILDFAEDAGKQDPAVSGSDDGEFAGHA